MLAPPAPDVEICFIPCHTVGLIVVLPLEQVDLGLQLLDLSVSDLELSVGNHKLSFHLQGQRVLRCVAFALASSSLVRCTMVWNFHRIWWSIGLGSPPCLILAQLECAWEFPHLPNGDA